MNVHPVLRFQMALWYRNSGKSEDADRSFRMAAMNLERKWDADHEPQIAGLVVEAWRNVREPARAEAFAIKWLKQDERSQQARESLANCFADQARVLSGTPQTDLQWELIEKSLSLSPNNVSALALVSELVFVNGEAGERANKTIDHLLASGQAPTLVHVIMGARFASAGDWKKARLHQELAISSFESALRLRLGHVPFRQRLAEAYRASGDEDTAKRIESLLEQEERQQPRPPLRW